MADADQQIYTQTIGGGSDLPVSLSGVIAEFSHVTEHGHPTSGAGQFGEGLERG